MQTGAEKDSAPTEGFPTAMAAANEEKSHPARRRIDTDMGAQLEAIKREDVPERLLKLARQLQDKLQAMGE